MVDPGSVAPAAHPLTPARTIGGTAGFLGLALLWTFVAAAISGGSPFGVAGVLAASAATVVAASAVPPPDRWIIPAAVVAAAGVLAIASGRDVVSPRPLGGPFSYANATGAFYLQAAIAGLMLASIAPSAWGRRAGAAAAAVAAVIVPAAGSTAATGLLVLPVAAYFVGRTAPERPANGRLAIVGMGALLALAVGGSVVVGATAPPGSARGGRVVDERRQSLWHDALTLIRDDPLTGVGPGRFATESPVARSDADARWAHNGFLQFGAETGVPGLLLLLAAFLCAIAGLARRQGPDVVTLLGAAALVAFGIGASLDYLMHFPVLTVTVAGLTGTALSRINESS
jgi:O-antigen ligase